MSLLATKLSDISPEDESLEFNKWKIFVVKTETTSCLSSESFAPKLERLVQNVDKVRFCSSARLSATFQRQSPKSLIFEP